VHAAPPVRVTLRRGALAPVFVGVCAAAAVGNVLAWASLRWDAAAGLPWAAVAALCAGICAAAWTRRGAREGELAWDGAQWQWQGQALDLRVAIDLDDIVLLRLAGEGRGAQWLLAARARSEGSWTALRAALHARRPPDAAAAPPAG
jgi:hypothetical protein